MAKDKLEDWDEVAANNLDMGGISLAENVMRPPAVNNEMREHMAQVSKWLGDDTIVAASSTDIGALPGRYISITGNTAITAFGTVKAGTVKYLKFTGTPTLTYNATSMILPGAVSIVVTAGDTGIFVSEGSGNWRCVSFQRAASTPNTWETIASGSVSGATVAYTNLSAYRRLRVTGFLVPATDGVNLLLQTSTNNGSLYDGGVGYYWQQTYGDNATVGRITNTATSAIQINPSGVGNASDELIAFTIIFEQFNQTYSAICHVTGMEKNLSGVILNFDVAGQRLDTVPRNAFRLFFSSGNVNSGHITLQGVRS